MTMKVYRYPADMEAVSENADYVGDYSNYELDVYQELPILPEEFYELMGKAGLGDDTDIPLVVYVLDDPKDIEDIQASSFGGGEFWNGEFSSYDDKYFLVAGEYGVGMFIAPVEFKEAIVEHINRQEESEDIGKDESKYVGSSKDGKPKYSVELSSASKKMFDKLYK